MRAMVLRKSGPIESNPLQLEDVPLPTVSEQGVLVRVTVCGICRTDLHVIEGDLPAGLRPLIPGHQIVGVVERCGSLVKDFRRGDRVGIAWLHETCGTCSFCSSGRENLCESAAFTGHTKHGGFAEYAVAPASFTYPLPVGFDDLHAAPLLCAGIIGFRTLRLAGVTGEMKLGIYGFGAAAHIAIQVARHRGARVFVCTRDERHRSLARELGAEWAGEAMETPPVSLDAAVIFAPAGELVPAALQAVDRGGVVVLGGIHMSEIPSMQYELLYGERIVRSTMNNTRADGIEFLREAAAIPVRTRVELFHLQDANRALQRLKSDAINGAAILTIS